MTFRSFLFVPGARPDRFAKAFAAGADAVCIDLEDAVPPPEKAAAREATLAALRQDRLARPAVGLRLNALRTPAGVADLAALAASDARPDFVMMPKVAHAEEAAIVAEVLGPDGPPLWPIIESAAGLEQAFAIAAAPRIGGLLFGGADFAADLGVAVEWEPLFLGRATVVAAAARAGVDALDVPYLDVEDDAGCEAEARRSRGLGFTGKACIHPRQLAPVKAAFTPSAAELARARRILEAFDAAGGAAALLDGKLIEAPVVRAATRVLAAEEG
jgi:citrate lyase subunit beta/citryl-CoA lyase/(S)-citramalyl-CoA lyase